MNGIAGQFQREEAAERVKPTAAPKWTTATRELDMTVSAGEALMEWSDAVNDGKPEALRVALDKRYQALSAWELRGGARPAVVTWEERVPFVDRPVEGEPRHDVRRGDVRGETRPAGQSRPDGAGAGVGDPGLCPGLGCDAPLGLNGPATPPPGPPALRKESGVRGQGSDNAHAHGQDAHATGAVKRERTPRPPDGKTGRKCMTRAVKASSAMCARFLEAYTEAGYAAYGGNREFIRLAGGSSSFATLLRNPGTLTEPTVLEKGEALGMRREWLLTGEGERWRAEGAVRFAGSVRAQCKAQRSRALALTKGRPWSASARTQPKFLVRGFALVPVLITMEVKARDKAKALATAKETWRASNGEPGHRSKAEFIVPGTADLAAVFDFEPLEAEASAEPAKEEA